MSEPRGITELTGLIWENKGLRPRHKLILLALAEFYPRGATFSDPVVVSELASLCGMNDRRIVRETDDLIRREELAYIDGKWVVG